jgi:hypothetical protein
MLLTSLRVTYRWPDLALIAVLGNPLSQPAKVFYGIFRYFQYFALLIKLIDERLLPNETLETAVSTPYLAQMTHSTFYTPLLPHYAFEPLEYHD